MGGRIDWWNGDWWNGDWWNGNGPPSHLLALVFDGGEGLRRVNCKNPVLI